MRKLLISWKRIFSFFIWQLGEKIAFQLMLNKFYANEKYSIKIKIKIKYKYKSNWWYCYASLGDV